MTKEIITGMLAGSVAILIMVGIGSFIGFALSPGPEAPADAPTAVEQLVPGEVDEVAAPGTENE